MCESTNIRPSIILSAYVTLPDTGIDNFTKLVKFHSVVHCSKQTYTFE